MSRNLQRCVRRAAPLWMSLAAAACADPSIALVMRGADAGQLQVTLTTEPNHPDERFIPSSTRFSLALNRAVEPDRTRKVSLYEGPLTAAEVALVGKSRAPADLRDRQVPVFAWGVPADAPTRIDAQPMRPLRDGTITLVWSAGDGEPFVLERTVSSSTRPALRLWPVGEEPTPPEGTITYCAELSQGALAWGASPPPAQFGPAASAPTETTLVLRRHSSAPCVDVRAATTLPLGTVALPPALADWPVDPRAITVAPSTRQVAPAEATLDACADGQLELGVLCAAIDDDRITWRSRSDAPVLVIGQVDHRHLATIVRRGSPVVTRGLPPSRQVQLDLELRTKSGTSTLARSITMAPARRHLVINEVLAHPRSGATSQRFVELVHDGAEPFDLAGLVFRDGDKLTRLPTWRLAPGQHVLLVPNEWVAGLAGDAPPPPATTTFRVSSLKLSKELALLDESNPVSLVISRFPTTTSTRTASHGRTSPDCPDDAADAFGWDLNANSTPGRPNDLGRR